jgi:S1-C subfamily serine protease
MQRKLESRKLDIATGMEKSVVQIITEFYDISYSAPWNISAHGRGTGSGFCVSYSDKTYILTNAHCVHNASSVHIRVRGHSDIIPVKVVWIVYECDLALLEFAETSFGEQLMPLHFGKSPQKLDKIYVYGYPLGGLNVSVTKGIVNRVQIIKYFHVMRSIAIQVDAPINFGNSGGPVISKDGSVVGVAFAGEDPSYTDNMGYIIPIVMIRYFFDSFTYALENTKPQSGSELRFSGLCDLGLVTQALHNEVLREYIELPTHASGIMVTKIFPTGVSKDVLQENDVLLKVDGKDIHNDGTMNLSHILERTNLGEEELVLYTNYIHLKMPGDEIKLTIWRNKKERELILTIQPYQYVIPKYEYQSSLEYYVIMGLIFLPVSFPLIQEKFKEGQYTCHLVEMAKFYQAKKKDEQVIILSDIMGNEFNKEFPLGNYVLRSVNRIRILNIEHLKKTIEAQRAKEPYLRFKFHHRGSAVILKSSDIKKYNSAIVSIFQ